MSDLLNSASLVLIPSGYKEDTVYSVVPSDGSGDLSFTRASNGTRVNSAGLVEVVAWNDLTYSEDFTNAVWTKVTSTVTANSTTAPNGTNTATKLESVAAGVPELNRSITGINTISIYAKAGNISSFRIWIGSEVIFDLSTGTVTAGTATMENVGNGWYRCIISSTNAGSVNPYFVATASGQFVYIWGAQVNSGSTAKPYFATTDRLNVPRLTYQNGGGGCPSLLLEKQSTNQFRYSEQFDDVYWVKARTTITANSIISPDGTQNADVIFPDTSPNTSHELFNNIGTSAVSGWSGFFKFQGQRWIGLFGSGDPIIFYDLQNGVIGNVGSGLSGSITNMGNGWYRCTYIKNSGTNTVWGFGFAESNGSMGIGGTPNTSLGFGIWGFQAEASSYATSYIGPTTSASATRVADACFNTGISSLIGQTEGVLFMDFEFLNTNSVQVMLSLHDNSNSKRIEIWADSATIYGFVGASSNFNMGPITAVSGNRYKIAVAYKSGDSAYYVNGTQIATNSTTFTISLANLIFDYWGGGYAMQGKVNETVLFPTRLTNAELASLTTI
jgi:hypothetical protein